MATINEINEKLRKAPTNRDAKKDLTQAINDRIKYLCNTNETNPSLVSARDVLEVLSHFVLEIRIENMEKCIEILKKDSKADPEEDDKERSRIENDIKIYSKNLRYLTAKFNLRPKCNFKDLIHILASKVLEGIEISSSFVSKILEIAKEFEVPSELEQIVKILEALNIKMLIYDQIRNILSIINDHLKGEPMKLGYWKGCCPLPIKTYEENASRKVVITGRKQLTTEYNKGRTYNEFPEQISTEYVKEIRSNDGLLVETEVLSIVTTYHLVPWKRTGSVSEAKKITEGHFEKIGHGPGKHKSHIFPYCYGGTNNHRNTTSVDKDINLSAMKNDEGKIKKKFEEVQKYHGKDIYALDLSKIIYEIREEISMPLRKERVTHYLDTNHKILATDRGQVSLIGNTEQH